MKFDEFWQLLVKSLSSKIFLRTLEQNKEFECLYHIDQVIVTPESSGEKRPVDKTQFQRVWRRSCKLSTEELFKPGSYSDITMNASYILSIMKYIIMEESIECDSILLKAKKWKVWKAN